MPGLDSLISPVLSIIDRVIPDKAAREAAKIELLKQENQQELETIRVQMSAILSEAQSQDKWTSRARPSFLYLMYSVILLSIIGAIAGIWFPEEVRQVGSNFSAILNGLPSELWWLFGTGYLGYTGARSYDKSKALK